MRIHPLNLKLLRDLATIKGQVVAVALVMACGLTMMVMARSLVRSLESTEAAYYRDNHFAEVFADLKRAPNSLGARLARIPGVAAIETRVRGAMTLDLPGMREPADALVLSLPEDRAPALNLLHLRRGRLPNTARRNEVVLSEPFALAHGFKPGDRIDATIRGAREQLEIVGIALSPEFVFESRPGDPLPDSRRFGVFWMSERPLAIALDLEGAFNNVILDVAPGAKPRDVMAELNSLLAPYGGQIAFDRSEHASARQVSDRITVLRGFAIAFPVLFLSVAAFMTSAALTRLIRLQREQIAQLKALGYSSLTIASHYLKFALVIVLLGALLGSGAGLWLGHWVTILYRKFFFFPELNFHPDWNALAIGALAAAAVCALGVAGAVLQAVRLPPAEAMRPEPPADFRPSLIERLGLHRWFSTTTRMALRNIERKPWQSAFTLLGLALATAIPIVPGAMRDGIAYIMEFQWTQAQRQDATLSLIEPASANALGSIQHLPGVIATEPFRSVPARITHGHHSRRIAVTGLPPDSSLNRLLDADGQPVALPAEGLLLSEKLAEILGVKRGDTLRIEVQEGRRPVLETIVNGTITDYSGIGAYMDIGALHRLMREGPSLSGSHLAIDPAQTDAFLAAVKEAPRIGSLSLTANARESFHRTTGEMMSLVQVIYHGFAVIVAFGVVYNSARIALSERRRDLATLRVIGFQPREVAGVLVGELLILTTLAIPIGLWLGGRLAAMLVAVASTETVRMPLILSERSYSTAVLVILLSSGLSFAVVSGRIRSLNLLSVLNARD